MSVLSPGQLGVTSWSLHAKDVDDLCSQVTQLELTQVQLGLNPLLDSPQSWREARSRLEAAGIRLASGMFHTLGENYSTLDTIRATGGVVPDEHWPGNWRMVQQVAPLARDLGLSLVSSHAGFIPEDASVPAFADLVDRIARIADYLHQHGITFLFETGQETATTLLGFIDALKHRGSAPVGVNFDPANMILYDKGNPIEALQSLMPHVRQVHIKDAVRTQTPGTWGREVPIGHGDVDWPGFFQVLRSANFTGPMIIEREGGEQRIADIRQAVRFLHTAMGCA